MLFFWDTMMDIMTLSTKEKSGTTAKNYKEREEKEQSESRARNRKGMMNQINTAREHTGVQI